MDDITEGCSFSAPVKSKNETIPSCDPRESRPSLRQLGSPRRPMVFLSVRAISAPSNFPVRPSRLAQCLSTVRRALAPCAPATSARLHFFVKLPYAAAARPPPPLLGLPATPPSDRRRSHAVAAPRHRTLLSSPRPPCNVSVRSPPRRRRSVDATSSEPRRRRASSTWKNLGG